MAQQEDHANNQVSVTTLTGKGAYHFTSGRLATELGWALRRLAFEDDLSERSIVQGRSTQGDIIQVVADSAQGAVSLDESQASLYGEQVIDLTRRQRPITLTVGLRTDYYSFNQEWTVSPRVSLRSDVSETLTLTAAAGVYYQQPTYRELRGTPASGTFTIDQLNRKVRSQRSVQASLGPSYSYRAAVSISGVKGTGNGCLRSYRSGPTTSESITPARMMHRVMYTD